MSCLKLDALCEEAGFPLGLENLENLEKWEGIFQSGKSQGILMRLEKSGKSQGKSHKILENWGNFRQILFVIFQWQLNEFVYYLLNLIKFSVKKPITEKILENGKKYWKSQGKVREFCQSGKVGTLRGKNNWQYPVMIHFNLDCHQKYH